MKSTKGPSAFARLSTAIRTAIDRAVFVAPLATRIVVGLTFLHTGYGKWQNVPRTVAFFTSLGIPFPAANAALVATLELVGGALLIAGLGTRFFAAGLSATMVVALLTADRQAFLTSWSSASDATPTDVASFTMLLFLLWLVLVGPGAASLDRIVAGFVRRGSDVPGTAAETTGASPAKQG